MTEEKGKVLIFPKKQPPPDADECFSKARDLMARADATLDIDGKARLLREAGEWLKRAEAKL